MSLTNRLETRWRRFRHRLYRDRPGWRRSPWAGGDRYWYEPDDGWPDGPTVEEYAVFENRRRAGGEGGS